MAAAMKLGLPELEPGTPIPTFHFIDQMLEGSKSVISLGDGWSAIASHGDDRPNRAGFGPDAYNDLARLVCRILTISDPEICDTGRIFVDDRSGREMAMTENEVLETCVLRTIDAFRVGGTTTVLNAGQRSEIRSKLAIRHSSAVQSVAHKDNLATVYFKRYRRPMTLTNTEADIVMKTRAGAITVAEVGADWAVIRKLENDRVVELSLPENASENPEFAVVDAISMPVGV
jgi:hypothetical protein